MTAPAPSGQQDLNTALSSCFDPAVTHPPFPDRLCALARALLNAAGGSVWTVVTGATGASAEPGAATSLTAPETETNKTAPETATGATPPGPATGRTKPGAATGITPAGPAADLAPPAPATGTTPPGTNPAMATGAPGGTEPPLPSLIAAQGAAIPAGKAAALIAELSAATPVGLAGPLMGALVSTPTGPAALVVTTPPGGPTHQGLAYERLSFLAQLSHARFLDSAPLAELSQTVATGDLQALVDLLARRSGADFAAACTWDGQRAGPIAVSGQSGATKRAALPEQLRGRLTAIAQTRPLTPTDGFATQGPGTGPGLALLLDHPTRAPETLPLTAALWSHAAPNAPAPRRGRRALGWGVAALVLAGIAAIPIPDGASLPATVEAVNRRILTAPFTTQLQHTTVPDGAPVAAGDVVARLDTTDLDLELAGLQSERASAVIDRETARLGGNAASLRTGEITVDRLDARIALLQARKDSATLRAPIAGIAVLGELTQRVGSTLRQGDPMLQIVDPAALALSLTIPDTKIGQVTPQDSGRFRPDFDPTLSVPARIETIYPAVDLSAPLPTIPAQAQFTAVPKGLRPGVQGVFQTADRYSPIGLVFYRNLRDWVILRFWL